MFQFHYYNVTTSRRLAFLLRNCPMAKSAQIHGRCRIHAHTIHIYNMLTSIPGYLSCPIPLIGMFLLKLKLQTKNSRFIHQFIKLIYIFIFVSQCLHKCGFSNSPYQDTQSQPLNVCLLCFCWCISCHQSMLVSQLIGL